MKELIDTISGWFQWFDRIILARTVTFVILVILNYLVFIAVLVALIIYFYGNS